MAKLDFPDASVEGQEFIADNGVIYTYIGTPPTGHWTGVSMPDSGQSLDSRFVQIIGDTMTGQLTLPGGGNDTQALQKQEIDALILNAEDPLLGNYLRTDSAAGAQVVQSTDSTEFSGNIATKGNDFNYFRNGVGSATLDASRGSLALGWNHGGGDRSAALIATTGQDGQSASGGFRFYTKSKDDIQGEWVAINGYGQTIIGGDNILSGAKLIVKTDKGSPKNTYNKGIQADALFEGTAASRDEYSGFYSKVLLREDAGVFPVVENVNHYSCDNGGFTSGVRNATCYNSGVVAINPDPNGLVAGEAYAFYGNISSQSDTLLDGTPAVYKYNFYAEGNAPNYFAGELLIGGTTASPKITLDSSNGHGTFRRVITDSIRSMDETNRISLGSGGATGMNLLTDDVKEGTSGSRSLQVNWNTTADIGVGIVNVQSVFAAIGTSTQDVAHFATATTTNQNTSGNLIGYKSNVSNANNTGTGGAYNFYADGNAPNYFAGNLGIGGTVGSPSIECNKDGTGKFTSSIATPQINGVSGSVTLTAAGSGAIIFKTKHGNGNYQFHKSDETNLANVRFESLTGNRIFNFPDKAGIIALTSDILPFRNGVFNLAMQSDDPAAFTTTLTTDEEGNEESSSVYNGTTEDLLSIIKDLRARVTALENA